MKKTITALLVLCVTASPCPAVLNPDEIFILGDSLMVTGGEDSLYKRLEAGLSARYKPFSPFPADNTSWCGFNDTETGYYLGGAAIANFLGTGGLPSCDLLQEALRQSTAQWAVIMLGHNDCLRLHHTRTAILNDFKALVQTVTAQGRIPLVISEWFIDRGPPLDGYPGPANGPCPDDLNDNLYWIRGKMKDYCSREGIPFLDLSDHLFSTFSQAYSKNPVNWELVDQEMKHNWADVYLRNGETGDGIHPEENARQLSYTLIGPWLETVLDLDLDGVGDIPDNCPTVPNPYQFDTDRDGIGNACDTDPLPCLVEELYDDAPETIDLLRRFRDEVLSTTPEGQALIGLYYGLRPLLFRAVEEDGEYREQMKQTIDTIVLILRQAQRGQPHLHYRATKHNRAPSGAPGLSRKSFP